jgi:hypothetical protein
MKENKVQSSLQEKQRARRTRFSRRAMLRKGKLRALAVVGAATVSLGLLGIAPANASGPPRLTSFTDLWSDPTPYSTLLGGAPSETVVMECWTHGAYSLGTAKWFYIAVGFAYEPSGSFYPLSGFVQATRVNPQVTVPPCP